MLVGYILSRQLASLLLPHEIQLYLHPVRVVDEELFDLEVGHVVFAIIQPGIGQPGFHGVKAGAFERHVIKRTGGAFGRVRHGHNVNDRLIAAIHPRAGKAEIGPRTVLEPQHGFVERNARVQIAGVDVHMIKAFNAHCRLPLLLCDAAFIVPQTD